MAKCTGAYCPMQVGYDVENCDHAKCLYRTKPMTNADRIRAMSDEELATDLIDMFQEICEDGVPSKEWMLEWLRQPADTKEE